MLLVKKRASVLVLILLCFSVIARGAMELPELGDRASGIISMKKEREIGQLFVQRLYQQAKVLNDPLVQNYVEDLLFRLAAVSELKDKNLTVILIDNLSVNAFAAPGGVIGVNTGLILHAADEQELAAVLAHELAHLSQRHFARNIENQKANRVRVLASMLGGIVLMAAGGGSVGVATMLSAVAGKVSQELRFSREDEAEADRIGIKTLYRSGMNPQAMPDMLRRLQSLSHEKQPLEFLQTHPLTLSRIADTEGRAAQYPKKRYKITNSWFPLMKTRVRLHYAYLPDVITPQFHPEIQQSKMDAIQTGHYGMALAYYKEGKFQEAEKQLASLSGNLPDSIPYQLLNADILAAQKNGDAMNHIRQVYEKNPDSLPVVMAYAHFLSKAGEYDKARLLLRKQVDNRSRDPFLWHQFANITGKAGNVEEYYKANANYLHLTGDTDKAIAQLEYALDSLRMSYEQRRSMQQLLISLKKDRKFAQELSI